MKKGLLLLLSGFLLVTLSYAQEKRISGRVISAEDRNPIAGVSVRAVGTNVIVQTDEQGLYSIAVPSSVNALEYRFLGYVIQTVSIGSRNMINVELALEQTALDEVVVTGYGTQRRVEVTGSIATVKGEVFKDLASPSFDKFLQGQVSGVQASTPSGMLGQPARIRIRGTNSISSGSEPLYVVDGVPYVTGNQGANTGNNPLGDINPNDIASVDVLKDGAATAIYGSRAANGVIIITTKRGQTGAPRLTYNNWFAIARPSKRFDLLNAAEFIEIANEKLTNAGASPSAFPTLNPETNEPYDTDWQDEIFRSAFQHNHSLSLSGATDKTNYYFSLGFADLEGIIDANNQRRYSARAKLEQKAFSDRLTVGVNTAISHTYNTGLNTGSTALSGNVAGALYAFPNVPAKWPDGTYNLSADRTSLGPGANTRPIHANYTNQRFVLDNNIFNNTMLNITGNAFADIELVRGLNFRSNIGVNLMNGEDYMFTHPEHGDGRGVNGRIQQFFIPIFRYNWQNMLTLDRTFGDHKVNAVAGLEYQMTRNRNFLAHGTNLSSIYFGINENIISGSLTNQFIGGSATENAFQSVFGRVNYTFKDRYFLSGTLRYDQLSALPHGNQGATLPGVSAGWRISEEAFFDVPFISELRIRGGWARVGNTEIGNYPYAGLFAATQYGDWSGIRYNQAGNDQLRFETSNKINIGLDAGLLDNRISLTGDFFRNDINNLILAVPTPPSLGVPGNQVYQNIGEMYNQGWEFSINADVIENDNFRWTSSVNATFVRNRIVRLVDGNDVTFTYHINREGHPIGSFYGYVYKGVNAANGNPIYEKADGQLVQQVVGTSSFRVYDPANPEDVSQSAAALGPSDKRILGEGNPTWFGGFNNTLYYKGFDLNIFLTFSGGNKVYNVTRQEALNNQYFANSGRELLNRWTTPGQRTDVPRLYYGADNQVNQVGNLNSRFLENGAFLRAQNIALGYTFNNGVLRAIRANTVRVFAQVQNAFVITDYSGLDPELASSVTTNTSPGVDNRTNPLPRTFTFGLNVGF